MSLRNPERGIFSVKGLIFSLGLLASFIFVGVLYGGLIRPGATKALLASTYDIETSSSFSGIFIILKDYEQQICLSLFLWGLMIIVFKFFSLQQESKVLGRFAPNYSNNSESLEIDLLGDAPGLSRERAGEVYSQIDQISEKQDLKNRLLPYVMARGLQRYHLTGSVSETTETIMGRLEVAAEQQESELSMLRYLVWAIPSIGFIGTVRGIGVALQRADEALQGDISGVTSALGVAFNSTLVALFISIVLMLLIHILQSSQEGFILKLQTFCREEIIDRLFEKSKSSKEVSDQSTDSDSKTATVESEAMMKDSPAPDANDSSK